MRKNTTTQTARNTTSDSIQTGIIRIHRPERYAVISNEVLRDKRLSFAARGVLSYLFTHKHNWKMQVTDLINQSPLGRDAVYTIIRELKRFGYIRQECIRNSDGTFRWETMVYESPVAMDDFSSSSAPETSSEILSKTKPEPLTGFPQAALPEAIKPHYKNYRKEEVLSKEVLNKTLSLTHENPVESSLQTVIEREQENRKPEPAEKTNAEKTAQIASLTTTQKGAIKTPNPEQKSATTVKPIVKKHARSVFPIEVIVAYVKHLQAQGEHVQNVMGLAYHIHKTMTHDALIEAYLTNKNSPQSHPPTTKRDVNCPQCFGTGIEVVAGNGARKCPRCRPQTAPQDSPSGNQIQHIKPTTSHAP